MIIMLNNSPSIEFKKEITKRLLKAYSNLNAKALESIILEVYATAYGSGYDDALKDSEAFPHHQRG